MKHKGAVMEYSMERMNDLMRAYDEYISSCDYIRMPEVYKVIVNMPSRKVLGQRYSCSIGRFRHDEG